MGNKSNGKTTGAMAALDPRALIFESYRIDGITGWGCRTIFLDWALGWPVDTDPKPKIEALLAHYAPEAEDHPMTQVLREALAEVPKTGRRGGRKARLGG